MLGPDGIDHQRVVGFPELIAPGALLVVNDTRVRRARIFGRRLPGGGRVELLLLGAHGTDAGRERWRALGRANKPLVPGTSIDCGPLGFRVVERGADGELVVESERDAPVEGALERIGRMPIPPYLNRADDDQDVQRYQTVFARVTGSAAAPTAGLHLSQRLLDRLAARGVEIGRLTLHVGTGTFRTGTAADLDEHPMHTEPYAIEPELAAQIARARERARPVVAVGTTVVRALESAADPARPGQVRTGARETGLLIQPGYRFRVVDALLTNFHAPKSTLLALVSAFAGRERVLEAYRAALAADYRFLSYGDAMWIPERLSG